MRTGSGSNLSPDDISVDSSEETYFTYFTSVKFTAMNYWLYLIQN